MIIFGTRGITSVLQKGTFHCPACGAGADFERKGVRRWFTLFFIPCIPLHQAADYLECKRCGGTFKPGVLTWNGVVPGQAPPPVPVVPQQEVYQLRPSVDPKTGMPLPPPVPQPQLAGSTVISYQSNGLATASLVFGVLGLFTSLFLCPGFIFIALALIFGILALGKVRKGNGLVGGKGTAKAGLVCSAVGAIIMTATMIVFMNLDSSKSMSRTREPWRQAASNVKESSYQTAMGNSPKAIKLAQDFSSRIGPLHGMSFTSKRRREVDSRFVVHCELSEGKCAFLVFVPDYRKYKGATRDSLNELAWLVAREAAISGNLPEETQVCVGLKGVVNFGDILSGTLADESPVGIHTNTNVLNPFFSAPVGTEPQIPAQPDGQDAGMQEKGEEQVLESEED